MSIFHSKLLLQVGKYDLRPQQASENQHWAEWSGAYQGPGSPAYNQAYPYGGVHQGPSAPQYQSGYVANYPASDVRRPQAQEPAFDGKVLRHHRSIANSPLVCPTCNTTFKSEYETRRHLPFCENRPRSERGGTLIDPPCEPGMDIPNSHPLPGRWETRHQDPIKWKWHQMELEEDIPKRLAQRQAERTAAENMRRAAARDKVAVAQVPPKTPTNRDLRVPTAKEKTIEHVPPKSAAVPTNSMVRVIVTPPTPKCSEPDVAVVDNRNHQTLTVRNPRAAYWTPAPPGLPAKKGEATVTPRKGEVTITPKKGEITVTPKKGEVTVTPKRKSRKAKS